MHQRQVEYYSEDRFLLEKPEHVEHHRAAPGDLPVAAAANREANL
jgi:hypothetical protein